MKKAIFLSTALFLLFAIQGEAQRRSSERSDSRNKVEQSKSNKSQAAKPASRPSSAAPARQSSRSSAAARPAPAVRSSQTQRKSGDAVRNEPRKAVPAAKPRNSQSRSSGQGSPAARPQSNPGRSSGTVARSSPAPSGRASSPANTRPATDNNNRSASARASTARPGSGNAVQSRQGVSSRERPVSARPVKENPASHSAARKPASSGTVYHSSRLYVHRHPVRYTYVTPPRSREYRAVYFPYRRPARIHIHWTMDVYRFYVGLYPVMRTWSYYPSYTVSMVSAYDAMFHVGEIRTVFGKVRDTYYAPETDEYFLYFGAYYPYHDFTVVIPGNIARRFSRNPLRYFDNDHVVVTGLITEFDGKPEMVLKHPDQIRRY